MVVKKKRILGQSASPLQGLQHQLPRVGMQETVLGHLLRSCDSA